eukprot:TRINITY_DN11175_c0_g1_i2.p1 TRINITY_DN11175_c0_g1~~TRINITY_DN11175_c0_g1_i2.p1  ORF type:complete len:998 (-),score=245.02 TRINITY_DN11175_c0_g1_i2:29-3022(-)
MTQAYIEQLEARIAEEKNGSRPSVPALRRAPSVRQPNSPAGSSPATTAQLAVIAEHQQQSRKEGEQERMLRRMELRRELEDLQASMRDMDECMMEDEHSDATTLFAVGSRLQMLKRMSQIQIELDSLTEQDSVKLTSTEMTALKSLTAYTSFSRQKAEGKQEALKAVNQVRAQVETDRQARENLKIMLQQQDVQRGLTSRDESRMSDAEVKSTIIKMVPFFRLVASNDEFVNEMAVRLAPLALAEGATVVKKGDQGTAMYFILHGELAVKDDDGGTIATLRAGDFFGELALVNPDNRRTATVAAASPVSLLVLEKTSFQQVVKKYPAVLPAILDVAGARVRQLFEEEVKKNGADGNETDRLAKQLRMALASQAGTLKQLFQKCDVDGSGGLDQTEFEELLGQLGLNAAQAAELFSLLDKDNSGRIEFMELSKGVDKERVRAGAKLLAEAKTKRDQIAKEKLALDTREKELQQQLKGNREQISALDAKLARMGQSPEKLSLMQQKLQLLQENGTIEEKISEVAQERNQLPKLSEQEQSALRGEEAMLRLKAEASGVQEPVKRQVTVTAPDALDIKRAREAMAHLKQELKTEDEQKRVPRRPTVYDAAEMKRVQEKVQALEHDEMDRAQRKRETTLQLAHAEEEASRVTKALEICSDDTTRLKLMSEKLQALQTMQECQETLDKLKAEEAEAAVLTNEEKTVLRSLQALKSLKSAKRAEEDFNKEFERRYQAMLAVRATKKKSNREKKAHAKLKILQGDKASTTAEEDDGDDWAAFARQLIGLVPIFAEAAQSSEFVDEMVNCLHVLTPQAGTEVIKKGAIGKEMYFVVEGDLSVVLDGGREVSRLKPGDFFGEIALLMSTPRTANIIAITTCRLLMLTKDDFDDVSTRYPLCKKELVRAADSRVSLLLLAKDPPARGVSPKPPASPNQSARPSITGASSRPQPKPKPKPKESLPQLVASPFLENVTHRKPFPPKAGPTRRPNAGSVPAVFAPQYLGGR